MKLETITEFLKLLLLNEVPPILWIFSVILLFAPTNVLDMLGLTTLVPQYRPLIGTVFLLSSSMLIVRLGIETQRFIKQNRDKSRWRESGRRRLQALTTQEQAILQGYINMRTRSQFLDSQDGVVNGLEAEGIIYRASLVGELDNWAYNIQPWAWDYLNAHRELLTPH
jgi:Super-infection exclusion protein B